MAKGDSMGFVEVIGLVAALEAADAMVKAANVEIKTVANADAALISVICQGDLASCGAAVDAGKAAASRLGQVVNSTLIPRPDGDFESMVDSDLVYVFEKKTAAKAPAPAGKGGKKA